MWPHHQQCGLLLGYRGTLGDGTSIARALPVRALGGMRFLQVVAGGSHSCGVTISNQVYCWGTNYEGQLGDGSTEIERLTPVAVVGGLEFRGLTAGSRHTCGITMDNRAYCWGEGLSGQLGNGTSSGHNVPVAVAGGHRFKQVSAGPLFHTCAIDLAESAYCWGQQFIR